MLLLTIIILFNNDNRFQVSSRNCKGRLTEVGRRNNEQEFWAVILDIYITQG